MRENRNLEHGRSRFSGWVSAIGTTGSVDGDGNAATLSYSLGGSAYPCAALLRRRLN